MNTKSELKAKTEKTPLNKSMQAHEDLVNQLLYLQQTIGNKEVGDLITKNIIHSATSPDFHNTLVENERKKREYEQKLIRDDMEEIEKEVERRIAAEKIDDLEAIMERKPEGAVFANIRANMYYIGIPGDESVMFYHETKLVDFTLSNREIEKKGESQETKRGMMIPVTFSLRVELPEGGTRKTRETQNAEESGKEANEGDVELPGTKEGLPEDTIKANAKTAE